jgi:hypothetical protein
MPVAEQGPTRDESSEVSFAGNLSSMPLGDLLGWMASSRNTGRLVIDGPEYTKRLFVDKGLLTASSSTNPREYLSYYLVGWGLVAERELDHLFEMQKQHGAMIGQLLVTLGLVTIEQLEEILTMVTEELVYEAFHWPSGSFRFVEGKVPAQRFHPLRIELLPLVLEGVRRTDEMERLRHLVPSLDYRPRSKTAFDVSILDLERLTALTEYDGSKSLEEIALERRQRSFSVVEEIAADMEQGLVELLPPREKKKPDPMATVQALYLQAEECLGRGQLLKAWTTIHEMSERVEEAHDAEVLSELLLCRIDEAVEARGVTGQSVVSLAIPKDALLRLECSAHEGFILSRVDGRQRLDDLLPQLPGDRKHNILVIVDLVDRGILEPL